MILRSGGEPEPGTFGAMDMYRAMVESFCDDLRAGVKDSRASLLTAAAIDLVRAAMGEPRSVRIKKENLSERTVVPLPGKCLGARVARRPSRQAR
jgi:hypothetical protein